MEIDIRPFEGEPRAFLEAGELPFGERAHDADVPHFAARFEADRSLAARDGDRIVGTAGAHSFELVVPGATMPAAGVTIVGVHPTHRRRGILRRMMRAQLDDVHERGEPVAILWASEGSIYQRFGYGLATQKAAILLDRDRSAFRRPVEPAGTMRLVDVDEGRRLFPPVHDAILNGRPGFFARGESYWEHDFFTDPEHWRQGASAAFHVVHEVDGAVDGYARYRIKDEWDGSGPQSKLIVAEALGTTPAAQLQVWQYLLGVDLVGKIEAWNLAVDDAIVLNVAEPRRLRLTVADALWLRVVDVAAALAGRRYRSDGRIVIEVADEFCPWNAGRWALLVDGGEPSVATVTDDPDITCDVTDLGAAFLGAFSFAQLSAAGRVIESAPGGVTRADGLFRTDVAPWCPRVF
jgi:predicted acetyltransferase